MSWNLASSFNKIARRTLGVALAFGVTAAATTLPAEAHDHHHGGWDHHGGFNVWVVPPPVIYAPQPRYYAPLPPPVVYVPQTCWGVDTFGHEIPVPCPQPYVAVPPPVYTPYPYTPY